ncbi:molybdopterin dinucleotide binding domain-containing protein [Streptomyces sp. INA 01156]
MAETEILARLVLAATGRHGADPAAVDRLVVDQTLGKAVNDPHSPVHGRDPEELAKLLTGDDGPERRLDMMLRLGPYGDGFGAEPDGLTLNKLLAHPHGIDLGPLRPPSAAPEDPQRPGGAAAGTDRRRPAPAARRPRRTPRRVRPRRPPPPALQQQLDAQPARPHRRLQPVHFADPPRRRRTPRYPRRRAGTGQGRRGEVTAPAEVTDGIRQGVVSLPHGWGHDRPGTRLRHAGTDPAST